MSAHSQPMLHPSTMDATHPKPPEGQAVPDVWDRVKQHIYRFMAAGTAIGIGLVISYFLRIHYFPIDSLTSLASIGGIAAAIAIAAMGSLVLMFGVPAVMTNEALQSKYQVDLLSPLWMSKTHPHHTVGTQIVSLWRSVGLICAAIGLPWIWVILDWLPLLVSSEDIAKALRWACASIWFIVLVMFTARQRPAVDECGPQLQATTAGYFVRIGWYVTYTVSGIFPLYAFFSMSQISDFNPTRSLWGGLAWLFGSAAAMVALQTLNFGISFGTRIKKQEGALAFQAAATGYLVCIILAMLGIVGYMLDGTMRAVSLRLPHVHIVLKKETCDGLRLAGVEASDHAPLSGSAKADVCVLHDATVLSRMGAKWRIACNRGVKIKDPTKGFNVDADSVVAWVDVVAPTEPENADHQLCKGMWEPP